MRLVWVARSVGKVQEGGAVVSVLRGAAVLVLAGVVPAATSAQRQAAVTTSLVFDEVTVVDVDQGKHIPGQRVVIVGNRIQSVGGLSAVSIPKGAQVVPAKDKYLMPGLWDLHVHPRRSTDLFYPMFLANGVTGIRDAGSEVPLDTLRLWQREILAGTRVGPPRQIISGRPIRDQSDCDASNDFYYACVSSDSAQPDQIVESLRAAGADMLKTYTLSPETYFAVAAAARRLGIPFGGHVETLTQLEASDSGARLIDHMHWTGPEGLHERCYADSPSASVEQCQPVADRFRHNGTWLAPTLLIEHKGGPRAQHVAAYALQRFHDFWDGTLPKGNWLRDWSHFDLPTGSTDDAAADDATAAAAAKADSLGFMYIMQRVRLPIVAASDVNPEGMKELPPGLALHAELAAFVAEGLTPLDALQTATLDPARLLHATDSLGTVAAGKLADLVLLDADPLADITNTTTVRAVVANGRYFDRMALDSLLTAVQVTAKQEP